ncbi:hypothetical protein LRZ95_00090 [Candidatus Gracilibacteria bacterium]|nr:hypothetical protein [Candidatus Gracilibacteria bacterium]
MSDFYNKQMEFVEESYDISEVQNDKILLSIINDYLKKNRKEGVDNDLVNFINAKGDKNNVIKFITYTLNNNPNNLSTDDLMQLANLKTALIKNELNSIQGTLEKSRNIDFQIVGGTITVKTLQIKWKGGLNFSKGKTRDIAYEITDEQINRVKGTKNKYEILLKRENSNRIYKFYIKYNGGNSLTIYDQYGGYIGRQIIETKQKTIIQGNNYRKEIYQTPGKLTIDTKKEKIKLDIMFNN